MNPILARFQHEPSLLGVGTRAWFESCIEGATRTLASVEEATDEPKMADDFWFSEDDWRSRLRPYNVRNGILQIPVKGALLNNFPWQFGNWATGYEYIQEAMKRGVDDSEVRGIALVIDSPGGMVAGNFDLVDRMYAMRGRKPIKAFAAESAYSAAYSIASAADDITVTRSGGVGSVGVVTMHVDFSEMLNDAGVKVTFIYAGKHKVDGNPYEVLPEAVRERIQERIDTLYTEFVGTIARNRGMDEKAVRKTEALTYSAQEALDIGFADHIGALDDEMTAFAATLELNKGVNAMADEPKAKTYSEEDLAAAVTKATADATAAATVEGATAERTRISTILDSEEAKTRPSAARMLAFDTDKTPEAVALSLAKLPEEKAEVPSGNQAQGAGVPKEMFTAAMNGTTNPDLDAEGNSENEPDGKTQVDEDRALIQAAGLAGFKPATAAN